MSWTSRLKKAVGGGTETSDASSLGTESPALSLPAVEAVEPGSLSRDEILSILREDLALISDGKLTIEEIEPEGHLFDFGYVDSLSAVVFLARIEERFGTQIEDIELIETTTDLVSISDRIKG